MITREDCIEQSVTDFARQVLTDRGYIDDVVLTDSFQGRPGLELDKTIVALGFNFDNEGEAAECGSDLTTRIYSHQFFVFGTTQTFGRNVAQALKFGLDVFNIPLKDIADAGQPVVDQLVVDGVTAERQIVPDPEPWQQFVWTTTLRVEDTYRASLA